MGKFAGGIKLTTPSISFSYSDSSFRISKEDFNPSIEQVCPTLTPFDS
jgi:hypothetical protein